MNHEPRRVREPYTPPEVETLAVQELIEAVGPVQALSSGTVSPTFLKPARGSTYERSRHGPRG